MFDDNRPLFQQIADLLADGIVAGRYVEGSQVPSTTELSAFYRINPATVGKGVNLLVEGGVLHKRRGLGMFVTAGARDQLLGQRTGRFRDDYVRPLLREADQLGLTRPDVHRLIDTEPINTEPTDPAPTDTAPTDTAPTTAPTDPAPTTAPTTAPISTEETP